MKKICLYIVALCAIFMLDSCKSAKEVAYFQNVDYVEVLKDSNMYGVRGANGVILITTLKGNNK